MDQVLHSFQHLSLLFLLHIEEEEAATAGTKQLSASSSGLATLFVKGINAVGTDGFCGLSL